MARLRARSWIAAVCIAMAGATVAIALNAVPARHLTVVQQALLNEAHATFERAWVATGPAAGGYTIYSSSMPSSLYSTSWTIQLIRLAGAIPDTVDSASVARSMGEAIAHPERNGVPSLEALWLALQTLKTLHITIPTKTVVSILPAYLTSGGLYSFEPGGEASWGATSIAARVLTLVGEAAPAATVGRVLDALVNESPPATIEELGNIDVPVWEAADELLSGRGRLPFQSKVDGMVSYLEEWIASNVGYGGGQILGVVVSLDEIARANSAAVPAVDLPALWETLRTPNGGFAATQDALVPDPHTTYEALRLGAPADRSGLEYFRVRARSDGWPADQTQLDPCSTYMGAVVDRAVGDDGHNAALSLTASHWLSELNGQLDVSEAAICVLALGETVGIEPPRALVDQLRTAATTSAPSLRIQILRIVRMPLGPSTDSAASAIGIPEAPIKDMEAYEACLSYRDFAGRTRNCELPVTLRMLDGTYKRTPIAPVSDLRSTVVALQSSGDLAARMDALRRFRDVGYTWMAPIGTTPNVNNLYSAFLSLVLADVIRNPRYL